MTAAQIASVARAAGFTGNDLVTAVAIVFPESGGDPSNQSHNSDSHHSTDLGLWQINDFWEKDILAMGSWSVPIDNAKMAFATYTRAGRKFSPWNTYKHGLHAPYMAKALAGVAAADPGFTASGGAPGAPSAPGGPGGPGALTPVSAISSVSDLTAPLRALFDPHNWLRFGMFVVGLLLLHLGVDSLTDYTTTAQQASGKAIASVGSVTKKVTKVAEVVGTLAA